ncbi:LysE family transporter [Streptomyces sp. NPDC014744]|uniref:LysE family transporter n=1 Tax=Streptomyces sp. NPDC014744 TaxID=3364903 RepID=UPI0036F5844A
MDGHYDAGGLPGCGPAAGVHSGPKALLLYFSLFPQFIDPATGWTVAAQTGLLSTMHLTACAVVYLAVGVLARTVLSTRPSAARVVTRISGAMMIAIGAFLLVERLAG